ncbi:MAG: hypothetical protein FJ218_08260 [Ignavibacteria bacterium]|nr:hypothetical protein [Ignavibacteria bacterium]
MRIHFVSMFHPLLEGFVHAIATLCPFPASAGPLTGHPGICRYHREPFAGFSGFRFQQTN